MPTVITIWFGIFPVVRLTGAKIGVLDMNESRLEFCHRVMGVRHMAVPSPNLENDIRELTGGHLPDVVIDATRNIRSMSNGLSYIAHGGRLVFVAITTDESHVATPGLSQTGGNDALLTK